MQPSTERLLRYRLGLDLVIPGFVFFGTLWMAGILLLGLFGGYVLRPLEERLHPPTTQSHSTQSHKHVRSHSK